MKYWCLAFWMLASIHHALAAEEFDKLKVLLKEIQTTEQLVEKQELEKNDAFRVLRELEQQRFQQEQKLDELHSRNNDAKAKHQQLNEVLKNYKVQLQEELSLLASLMHFTYKQYRITPLRLALESENWAYWQQALTYSRYFVKSQLINTEKLKKKLTLQQKLISQVNNQREEIQIRQATINQQLQMIKTSKKERKQALHILDTLIANNNTKVDQLKIDKNRLDKLITRIKAAKLSSTGLAEDELNLGTLPFTNRQSQLRWPVIGTVISSENSVLKINTEYGAEVYAIAEGQVVFADWMRGLGQIIILSHGDNYFSLYGQNQQLLFETGSWVKEGQAIAKAGDSGGKKQPQLHFEIRKGVTSLKPLKWLQNNG